MKKLVTFVVLILVFSLIAVLMAFYTFSNLVVLKESVGNIHNINLQAIDFLIEADRDAYQSRLALREALELDVDINDYEEDITSNMGQVRTRFDKFYDRFKQVTADHAENENIKKFNEYYQDWQQQTNTILTLLKERNIAQAAELYATTYSEAFDPMRDQMDVLTGLSLTDAERNYKNTLKDNNRIIIATVTILISLVIMLVFSGFFIRLGFKTEEERQYYVSILDAVPLPITVTDMDMHWTFVNKAVEDMIKVDREKIYGQHCSNWNADICKTDKCGVAMLRKGYSSSEFVDAATNKFFKTNVSYIHNKKGDKTGHIEVITDIDAEKKIKQIAVDVTTGVNRISLGLNQINDSSQQLSMGASEQASSLEEMSSSITQINSQADQVAKSADKANQLSKQVVQNAINGNAMMNKLIEAMAKINESSDEIKKIVKIIDDIAFQTNLLALNANVEAARAGRYGKGFAVVAEEVRNLASKSAESVKETTAMVEESISNIASSNTLVEKTAKQLEEIVSSAEEAVTLVDGISIAGKEQSEGLKQISMGLQQIDTVTQSNAANAEETASSVHELSTSADKLRTLVLKFKDTNEGESSGELTDSNQKLIEY